MPVIAIVNQKGGTGKTTLSTNLACAFAETSAVLLLDADSQGSAQDWADNRTQRMMNLDVRGADPGRLIQNVRLLAPQYAWVIIDGPPGITRTSADAVRAAEVVLIPAKASPFDVWAASDIVAAVKARQETAGGKPIAAFVITMTKPRTRLGRQIDDALEEYGLPTLQSRTTERVAYPMTAIEGKSVLDGGDGAARNEIIAMRDEIESLCNDHAQQARATAGRANGGLRGSGGSRGHSATPLPDTSRPAPAATGGGSPRTNQHHHPGDRRS